MTKIVIVGGGFGGLQTILSLEKKFRTNPNIELTLVDKRDYHLFTPNLFEVATAEEEITTVSQMTTSITIPYAKIFNNKKIKFVKSGLNHIDPAKKLLELDRKQINYDYLVLALGSQSDFFNIPGAEKNALVLKDLPDALRVRNQIEFSVQAHKFDSQKKTVRLVVAGGGYTGVELAGELRGLADFMAWKNRYPREKIEIEIIEGANALVPGFDPRLSRDAYGRLQELGVRVRLSARVTAVDEHFVELMTGDKIAYDVLVWTAGIKACDSHLAVGDLDRKGRLPVNEFFQVKGHREIFALGDIACVLDGKGHPVPSSAQDAQDQAEYLAYALPYIIKNLKPPKPYRNIMHGFIVNVGGKWAIMSYNGLYLTGWFAYLVDKLAHLRYYISVVGWWKALQAVIFQMEIYSRND
ncbi:MAG: NAD(P)/FAD-dependent oxidoreductase [Candidatus Doudnabacteria bacterium]|nr:NAD(P)/FAD-dependent oxidoreductase [Candidatus Doudnabacteria bacterium]